MRRKDFGSDEGEDWADMCCSSVNKYIPHKALQPFWQSSKLQNTHSHVHVVYMYCTTPVSETTRATVKSSSLPPSLPSLPPFLPLPFHPSLTLSCPREDSSPLLMEAYRAVQWWLREGVCWAVACFPLARVCRTVIRASVKLCLRRWAWQEVCDSAIC